MNLKWIVSEPENCWQQRTAAAADDTLAARRSRLVVTGLDAQTIKGFGGCFNELGHVALEKLSQADQDRALAALFGDDGCRFSHCRIPIGASDYALSWYSLCEADEDYALESFSIERDRKRLIPYIKSARKVRPELTLFASPWSPPVWMKTFQVYNHGVLRWEEPVLEAYAQYFRKFVGAYAAEGIPVTQVHVQNEPRSNQKFPSCLWTGAKMRDFIRDWLGPLFKRENVPCEIWAGTIEKGILHGWEYDMVTSGTEDYAHWAHTILSDPEARQYVAGIGYQWNGKGALARTRAAFPEVPIMQTENECGDGRNTWGYAEYVFGLVWEYLTQGAVAYTYWNMILPEGGESTWGWKQNAMCTVTDDGDLVFNPEFFVMKHLTHAVRPGAVRLHVQGEWAAFSLAFRDPDGSVAIVCNNPLDAAHRLTLAVNGTTYAIELPPHSFHTLSIDV